MLIPGLLADGLLAMPANLMDLGSAAQVLECRQLVILLLCGRRKAPRFKQQATSFKHFRMILRNILKKQQAASFKHQAVDMKEIIGYKIVNKGEINI